MAAEVSPGTLQSLLAEMSVNRARLAALNSSDPAVQNLIMQSTRIENAGAAIMSALNRGASMASAAGDAISSAVAAVQNPLSAIATRGSAVLSSIAGKVKDGLKQIGLGDIDLQYDYESVDERDLLGGLPVVLTLGGAVAALAVAAFVVNSRMKEYLAVNKAEAQAQTLHSISQLPAELQREALAQLEGGIGFGTVAIAGGGALLLLLLLSRGRN